MAKIIGNTTASATSYTNQFDEINAKLDEISAKLDGEGGITGTVEPITITANGVYDITATSLPLGKPITLRSDITQDELLAAGWDLDTNPQVILVSCYPYGPDGVVGDAVYIQPYEMNGITVPTLIYRDGETNGAGTTTYIHWTQEAIDTLGVAEYGVTVGWYNDEDMSPAGTLTITLTENDVVEDGASVFFEGVGGATDVIGYNPITVNVPIPDGYIKPEGSTTITTNGTHDVTEFASAIINVPQLDTSDATATAAKMLKGETAYVDGELITGEIETYTGELVVTTVTIPKGTYVCSKDILESMLFNHTENIQFSSYYMKSDDEIESYDQPYTGMAFNDYGDLTYINVNENIEFTVAEDYGDGVEWWRSDAQTVTLETDQEVSEEFATWFNSNFEKQPDTVTIESGTYVGNDGIDFKIAKGYHTLRYNSNNTECEYMIVEDYILWFGSDIEGDFKVYEDDEWLVAWQTITLDTDQSVSFKFGKWFNSNFTKQALPTARIDVTFGGVSKGYIDLTNYVGSRWSSLGTTLTTTDGIQFEIVDYQGSEYVGLYYGGSTGQVKPVTLITGNVPDATLTCAIPEPTNVP